MRKGLEEKRKILIATESSVTRDLIQKVVSEHVAKCQFYHARDGSEALSKIDNDPPDLMIVENNLKRFTGLQITERIIKSKKNDIAVIILSEIPDTDHFVDQVVSGQVQFMPNIEIGSSQFLSRAMNYISHGDNAEFSLRFMAPDEILMKEGDKPDFVYILKKGRMHATVKKSNEDLSLGFVDEGDFVGEMSYINGESRSASIVAITDCELIEIPIDRMDHLLCQKPVWSKALLKTLTKRVMSYNKKLIGA